MRIYMMIKNNYLIVRNTFYGCNDLNLLNDKINEHD